MSNIDHWVRMNGIACLLEVTQNSLKNALRTGVAAMSNEDQAAFADRRSEWSKRIIIENDTANQEAHRALRKYEDAIAAIPIPGDDARLFCHCDDKGELIVEAFVDGSKYEIRVLESIGTRYQNLFDPIVQWAINRAQTGTLLDKQQADKFLKRLPKALEKGLKKGIEQNPYTRLMSLHPASPEYCKAALDEIREIGIGEADEAGRAQRIEHLRERMGERLPEQDHTKLIKFVRQGLLPKSNRLDAFVNAFNSFLTKKTTDSYKQDNSTARQEIQKIGGWKPPSENEVENLSADFVAEMLGLDVIATARQIRGSGLRWREMRAEEWMNAPDEDVGADQQP